MKTIKQHLFPFSFMLIIPVLNIFYILLNHSRHEVSSLVTKFDQSIPLVEFFVLPYLIWYPFILLTMLYLCIKEREIYFKTLIAYAVGLIICYMTYLVFQTTVPRPELTGNDIFTRMLAMVYKADQPYNCFPSIHVLSCYLMMKAIYKSSIKNRVNQAVVYSNSIMIILSTLFVKQHVILDVASGILVGELVYRLVDAYYEKDRILLWDKKRKSLVSFKRRWRMSKDFEI